MRFYVQVFYVIYFCIIWHFLIYLNILVTREDKEAKSRALDNLGRLYAKQGEYTKAIDAWMEKLPFCKSVLESTWLYHEIGRCHLELKYYQDAKEFGQKSLAAAEQADDKVWQLNATVLVGQAEGKFQWDEELLVVLSGKNSNKRHVLETATLV